MSDTTYLEELERWRRDRDRFFAEHYATPLAEEDLVGFVGIRYFLPKLDLVFSLSMTAEESDVAIEASTGTVSDYRGAGSIEVPFAGGPVSLQILHGEEGELFIPFRDATSGVSSYGGGRYVPVTPDGHGAYVVDFNRATNPYCAYDPDFSCPLPPPQNWFTFPIEAGELDYP
ncbi:MAG: DUF1684 domain-containing protein [Acidimicrobiia bacterium]|nr:DUF1684 domain-containing protein [Acidimicrobiia bacterium]